MRLSNNKTLKNKSIKESRAIKIANRLCSHNLRIEARTLDLENNELKQTGETYEQFGNLSRRIYRNTTKERKISHFLHDEIMFYCITDLISKTFSIKRDCDLQIEPYIDDWSYTSIDKHIALEYFSNKFSIWLNELSVEKQINVNISVKNIALLDDAKDRKKRFIDVLTSVISRAYFDCSDERFTDIPLIMLKNSLKENFNIDNATNDLILFMLKAILDNIQETKQEKKNLIHIPK